MDSRLRGSGLDLFRPFLKPLACKAALPMIEPQSKLRRGLLKAQIPLIVRTRGRAAGVPEEVEESLLAGVLVVLRGLLHTHHLVRVSHKLGHLTE